MMTWGALLLIAAACGTYAEPPPNSATLEAEQAAEETGDEDTVVAAGPTATLIPATATPVPATPTPTTMPATATPIPPTATEEPQLSDEEQNIVTFVQSFSNPQAGETLFNETYVVEMADGSVGEWACSTCHLVDNDEAGTGPGMLSLPDRAGERVERLPAEVYVYNSIIHPNDYIVEGYNENVMPVGYEDIFTEQELYDLTAYLLSIGE
jgi:hypothetical protein